MLVHIISLNGRDVAPTRCVSGKMRETRPSHMAARPAMHACFRHSSACTTAGCLSFHASASQVTAVDKSAPTTMCVLALGNSLAANYGPRLAAERVLPTLAPLLVVPTLSPQQFAIAMKTVRDVLSHVERSRATGAMEGSPRAGSLGGMVPSGGGGTSVVAGGKARTEAVDSDWMSVTAAGSATGGGALRSTGMPAASAVPAAPDGTDLLAGLTLQQSSVAASASQRPLAPTVGTSSSSGGSSSSGYGLAGRQVGSRKPMSSLVAVSATALPQPNWAFGGTSTNSGMSPTRPAQTSSWADPFAGLQGGSTGSAQRPAAIPQHVQQEVFDPFALGSVALASSSGKGQLPAKAQPQAAMQPPAGSFAAGADGSLI